MNDATPNAIDLFPELGDIEDEPMRHATSRVIDALIEKGNWTRPQAAPFIPGFLDDQFNAVEHTRAVTRVAASIANALESSFDIQIDRDTLTAACLLHDSSKWIEYEPDDDDGSRLSEFGKALPHPLLAAATAWSFGLSPEIVHAILAHSPQNPTRPITLVAELILHADALVTACSYDLRNATRE
jgi:putative nucleotidyltransferase with HDIG domain